MRADLATLFTVLIAITPGSALADVPAVPEPSCQCGPNGEWILCSSCPSGEAPAGDTTQAQRPQGTPPILKLAAGVVVVTGVVVGFAIAPGHMAALFGKSKTVKQAREAWRDERAGTAALEDAYTDAIALRRDLDHTVAAAGRPAREGVGTGYAEVDLTPPPEPWSPNGACSQLGAMNDRMLESMRSRAAVAAQEQLPTWGSMMKKAQQQTLAGIARAVGAEKLLKQGKALKEDYKRAKEMQAFLDELDKCLETKKVDPTNSCELVIANKVNAETKVFLEELQAGAGEAQERVRKASLFYRGFVKDLQRAIEKQALWEARC